MLRQPGQHKSRHRRGTASMEWQLLGTGGALLPRPCARTHFPTPSLNAPCPTQTPHPPPHANPTHPKGIASVTICTTFPLHHPPTPSHASLLATASTVPAHTSAPLHPPQPPPCPFNPLNGHVSSWPVQHPPWPPAPPFLDPSACALQQA